MASNKISNIDILAKEIADLYKISAITSQKKAVEIDYFHGSYIPDQVSRIPGYMDLNMMLKYAAQYFSPKVIRNAAEDKEVADLKIKVGPLSAHVDRLEQAYNKSDASDEVKREMYRELLLKKDELENMRLRLGELSTKKNVMLQDEKLSQVKQAFKILSSYNKKKQFATEFFNKIKNHLCIKVKAYVEPDEYNDDEEYEEVYEYGPPENDGWNTVGSEKKNPFASMNAKKGNAWNPPACGGAGSAMSAPPSASEIEDLIKRHNENKYLTPSQRQKVLTELEKREKEAKKKAVDEYPSLCVVAPKTVSKMNFAEMAAKAPPVEEVIAKPKKILAETMIKGKKFTLVEMESDEPEIVEQKVTNGFKFTVYQYKDGSTFTVSAPTRQFYDAIAQQNEYRQYIHDVNHKPWLMGMDYDEWCEFKDECAYQQELEHEREMEKYGMYGAYEYVPESARNDEDFDHDEYGDEYPEHDNTNYPTKEKQYSFDDGITA